MPGHINKIAKRRINLYLAIIVYGLSCNYADGGVTPPKKKLRRASTKKIIKIILAIHALSAATPPNPKPPAIKAIIKKMTVHCNNIVNPFFDKTQ